MKIIELRAENLKRIKAVRITPDGSMIQISGKNGAGKTSVLDSIAYALGGRSVQPSKPIREGCDRAEVVVDLGDIIVRRTWTADDKTYLSVESKEGAKFPSPQAVLDKLVGELTFDPLAFSRMDPKQQAATLKQIAKLDFEEMDQQRESLYQKRTLVNRDLKTAEAELGGMEIVNAPDEELSIAALAKQHSEAMAVIRANESKQASLVTLQSQIKTQHEEISKARSHLQELESGLTFLLTQQESRTKEFSELVNPDVAAIAKQLETAEATNAAVRAKKARAAKADRATALRRESEQLSSQIDGIDQQKKEELEAAKMPVKGLAFTADGITFKGIPFQQASAAEQLRVSVAMGLALNPKLRVMLIRDGSLLDAQSMTLLEETAEANDAQVWVERVADGDAVGVVIEDGAIVPAMVPA